MRDDVEKLHQFGVPHPPRLPTRCKCAHDVSFLQKLRLIFQATVQTILYSSMRFSPNRRLRIVKLTSKRRAQAHRFKWDLDWCARRCSWQKSSADLERSKSSPSSDTEIRRDSDHRAYRDLSLPTTAVQPWSPPESWTDLSESFPAMVEPRGGALADEEVEVHRTADCFRLTAGGGRRATGGRERARVTALFDLHPLWSKRSLSFPMVGSRKY